MGPHVARCMLIAKVLSADGIFTDEERRFLEAAMDEHGLTEEERARVRSLSGWDEAEPLVSALSLDDKREMMDGLVAAVLADGKVSPHEMQTIEKLSAALGLS